MGRKKGSKSKKKRVERLNIVVRKKRRDWEEKMMVE